MNFRSDVRDNVTVVRVEDERATVVQGIDDFKRGLLDLIEKGTPNIVVNLDRVQFADSSMLGALVSALKVATRKRGDLRISGLNPPVRAIFELTRLYRVFEIFENEEEAIASF